MAAPTPKYDTDESVCFLTYYVAFAIGLLSFLPGFRYLLAKTFYFLWTLGQIKWPILIICIIWIINNHIKFYRRSLFFLFEIVPKPKREREPIKNLSPPWLYPLLPPSDKKTLFIDLDQTLIFTFTNQPPPVDRYSSTELLVLKFTNLTFYVVKRPGIEELFRSAVSSDWLDPTHAFVSHRLYRDACSMDATRNRFKDLDVTGRRLDMSVVIDDDPSVYWKHYDNLLWVRTFKGERDDSELNKLSYFFVVAEKASADLRTAVDFYYGNFHWSWF
ncbi:hypothetical protein LUZ60_013177 [Juncus effusus]|nr:hypothetical protein LUZ60_013177 [Juncus effusus]